MKMRVGERASEQAKASERESRERAFKIARKIACVCGRVVKSHGEF